MTTTSTTRRVDAADALALLDTRNAGEKDVPLSGASQAFLRGGDLKTNDLGGPESPYRQNVWVHLCVSKIVSAVGSVPMRLSVGGPAAGTRAVFGCGKSVRAGRREGGGARRVSKSARKAAEGDILESGPLFELLSRPNERQTWRQFIEQTIGLLYICGRVHWFFDAMVGRRPVSMVVVPGSRTKPLTRKRDLVDELVGWQVTAADGSQRTDVPLDETVSFQLFEPTDPDRGLAPHVPGKLAIVSDYNSSLYNAAMFGNSAEPGGILSTDAKYDANRAEEIRTSWNQRHKGAGKAKSVAVLWDGLTWQSVASSMEDMQFISGKELWRLEICAVYGVPPTVAGFFGTSGDSSTYAGTEWERFWQDTAGPLCGKAAEAINEHIAPKFTPTAEAWADVEDLPVVQEMRRSRLDAGAKLWGMGVPLEDVNDLYELGLPPRPHYAVGLVAAGLLPAGDVASGDIFGGPGEGPPVGPDGEELPSDELGQDPGDRSGASGREKGPAQLSKAAADRVWAAWHSSWSGLAKSVRQTLRARLFAQERLTIAAIKRLAGPDSRAAGGRKDDSIIGRILLEVFGDGPTWRGRVRSFLADANELGLRQALAEAGLRGEQLEAQLRRLMSNPQIIQAVRSEAVRISTQIDDATRRVLRGRLADGLQAGRSVNELADQVQEVMGNRRAAALTVARNSVGQSLSRARHDGHRAVGGRKGWIHSRGPGQRRPAHVQAERAYRQGIAVNEPFKINGQPMMHPRDGSLGATAKELVNCQCMSYLLAATDGKAAGDAEARLVAIFRSHTWEAMLADRNAGKES